MNPPKVIVNAEPPKEWFEIVGRGLERHNTAATSIVEYYPVCFVVREAGNQTPFSERRWMSEFCSNREANRLFCAWRQTREICRIGYGSRALRFAFERRSPTSRANLSRSPDYR